MAVETALSMKALYDQDFVLWASKTAEQLGISVVTVSRRVKKGLEILKETMTQEVF